MPDRNRKKQTDRNDLLRKASLLLTAAAAVIAAVLLAYLFFTPNIDVMQTRQETGVSRIAIDSCQELPCADAPLGVKTEYRFTLDQAVDRNLYLSFYTVHQSIEVYLDGRLIYSLKPAVSNHIVKTVGSNWTMLPLYREDAGKEVCVEIIPVYESFRSRTVEFLLGSPLAIYTDRLRRDLPQLLLGVIAVFVGLVFLCIAGYQLITQRKYGGSLFTLGLFSIMLGIWRLTDTRFTPFVFPRRPVFLFYVSLFMLILGMIPLICSVRERRSERRVIDAMNLVIALVCLVQEALQCTGKLDLRESLIVTHIVIICSAVVLLVTALYEQRSDLLTPKGQVWDKLPLLFLAGAAADAAAFYIRGTSSGLIFSLSALILYTVFMGIAAIFQFGRQEKLLLEQKAELERSKIAITLSQIQPHFLYNSLSAISDLCRNCPEARHAIDDFSIYLRGNMDSLTSQDLIPFSQELEHIETYLRLEKLRFGDRLRVVYAIEADDFLLPPLTVQPLVENAVKHGVCQKSEGGVVRLQTCREGDTVMITVEDNGAGFDPSQPPKNDRSHVGIHNVRSRLRRMVNGDLNVQSVPGVGTTATITLYENSGSA